MINYDTYKEIQKMINAVVKFYKICETLKITKTQFARYGQMPYEAAKQKYDEVCEKISNQIARKEKMEFYIKSLKKVKGAIKEFDEAVFAGLVDYIEVGKNNKTVYFKGGNTIEI